MASTEPLDRPRADPRRDIDRWLGNYSEDHRHPANIALHHACVPLIVWSVAALPCWCCPVPPGIGQPGLWVGAARWWRDRLLPAPVAHAGVGDGRWCSPHCSRSTRAVRRARPRGTLLWTGVRGVRAGLDRAVHRPWLRGQAAFVLHRSGLPADRARCGSWPSCCAASASRTDHRHAPGRCAGLPRPSAEPCRSRTSASCSRSALPGAATSSPRRRRCSNFRRSCSPRCAWRGAGLPAAVPEPIPAARPADLGWPLIALNWRAALRAELLGAARGRRHLGRPRSRCRATSR